MNTSIATLTQNLTSILNGSSVSGRWVDQINYDAPDGGTDEDVVPDGYYDADKPPREDDTDEAPLYPEGIEEEDQDDLLLVGGRWLIPARWEAYTEEEQASWLSTCAHHAKQALAALETLTAERAALLEAVSKLVPYAESRAEDLSEIARETSDDDNFTTDQADSAQASADDAWHAVESARKLLAAAAPDASTGVSLDPLAAALEGLRQNVSEA